MEPFPTSLTAAKTAVPIHKAIGKLGMMDVLVLVLVQLRVTTNRLKVRMPSIAIPIPIETPGPGRMG